MCRLPTGGLLLETHLITTLHRVKRFRGLVGDKLMPTLAQECPPGAEETEKGSEALLKKVTNPLERDRFPD